MRMQAGWTVGGVLLIGMESDILEAQAHRALTSSQGLCRTLPGDRAGMR